MLRRANGGILSSRRSDGQPRSSRRAAPVTSRALASSASSTRCRAPGKGYGRVRIVGVLPMRITAKGQVTIPQEIRLRLGLRRRRRSSSTWSGTRSGYGSRRAPRPRPRDRRSAPRPGDDATDHRPDPRPHPGIGVPGVLVDSNVLLDVLTEDPEWFAWSSESLARCADEAEIVLNPIVYAEVSVGVRSDRGRSSPRCRRTSSCGARCPGTRPSWPASASRPTGAAGAEALPAAGLLHRGPRGGVGALPLDSRPAPATGHTSRSSGSSRPRPPVLRRRSARGRTTLIGQTLAHYRVTAAIGAGGMGERCTARPTRSSGATWPSGCG